MRPGAGLRPDFIQALGSRAVILLSLGRRDEAVASARAVLSAPDTTARWNSDVDALYVLRETGHQAEAAELIGKLLPRWPQDSYVRGWIMVQLGRPDEGWTNVGRTTPAMALLLYWSPVWDASRNRPEFEQALAKAGFAHEYQVARELLAVDAKERGAEELREPTKTVFLSYASQDAEAVGSRPKYSVTQNRTNRWVSSPN